MLLKLDDDDAEWDTLLQQVVFGYNMSKHASTKFSPFFLMYGSINEWKKANTKLRKSSVLNANVERNFSKIHENARLFMNNHGELRTFTEMYEGSRRLVNTHKYAGIFDPEVLALNNDANWTLIGYFQSWKYFLNSTAELRAQLRFNDKILLDMQKAFPSFLISNRTTVGVHIRRGDMNTGYERNRGYSVAHLDYIQRAMQYYRDKYTDPMFVVCSDDIVWCKKHLVSKDTSFVHVSAEVDLAVLAHCTHSVITSGSYGWWGAFLAGGETIYYKNFPRRRSWLETQYKREDYYLPHWVGLD
ncbi:galactoside 2-alpha-L-fucosyltransferase Sec1-like [Gigantopelta aegis]|uniref:galactoside 2-alpha-L-fucosyltransferase Sec1-like n=1 Tax=Gigantopelta aegis TaxID=1735272 RepID=UPI001B88A9BE|nr:galactoside 2-alpha-L-fucosyltransferase Sec1-like [Gigantopelta aegis]